MTTDEQQPQDKPATQPTDQAPPTEPAFDGNAVTMPLTETQPVPTPSVAETLAATNASSTATPPVIQPKAEPVATSPTAPPTVDTTQEPSVTPVPDAAPPAATVQPAPDVAEVGATDRSAAPTLASPPAAMSDDTTSDRVRQKLGVSGEARPKGSEDIKSQRPDTPTGSQPIDIPDADDIDSDLDAEISAALSTAEVPSSAEPPQNEVSAEDADAPSAPAEAEEVGPGTKITGTVQHIHGDDIFLNAGLLHDVVISAKQFAAGKIPEVGGSVTAIIELVDEDGFFRARLPEARSKTGGGWDGLAVGQVIDCVVSATNKGGLQVKVNNLQGFLPASQVDLGYISDMEQYVGQKLTVQITEVKPKKRNLVVSRRVLLQAERESQQGDFLEALDVGQDYTGTVKTIKNYGAFVNLGPIDGFLHVGEISWSRINHPNEVLKEGQQIQVRVLKFDKEKNRISLGMKQMMQNPWQGLSDRYPSERIVNGKVTRTADFGAFVELEPGVEGLVHISELAWRRVGSVNEVLKVGEEKEFKVLEVDQKRKRVSLSLKALEQKPESMRKKEAEEQEPIPVRKPNPNLKGGMGGNAPGGLFGNPTDFT